MPNFTSEFLVYDHEEPCPYLPDLQARMPLRQPLEPLNGAELDERLDAGDRRCGVFLYRTQCRDCQACEPLRLDVQTFRPTATQRRVFRRGEQQIVTRIGQPIVDQQRVRLYNKHREKRGLADRMGPISLPGYRDFLTATCCETIELSYFVDSKLASVAIADLGRQAISAVYCYFDPDYAGLSLGVYSILKQIALARESGRRYLYLGLYIEASRHMRYKALYRPHERLIEGEWKLFSGESC